MSSFANQKANAPRLRPSSSALNRTNTCRDKEGKVDRVELRERFDKQLLPKYGFMWRSMVNARLAQEQQQEQAGNAGNDEKKKKTPAYGNKKGFKPAAAKQHVVSEDKENKDPVQQKQPTIEETNGNAGQTEVPSLLNAILSKQSVSLRVPSPDHDICTEDCDCADPIIEIDNEDASVYDVDVDEELADTDDDDEDKNELPQKQSGKGGKNNLDDTDSASLDEDLQIDNASVDNEEDDDESIVVMSKTPKKKKMFIIDSDEDESDDNASISSSETVAVEDFEADVDSDVEELEDDESVKNNDDDESITSADESVKSNSDHSFGDIDSSEKGKREYVTKKGASGSSNSNAKTQSPDILDGDSESASSSEEEWIEISSDEEEEEVSKPKRVNTVVILSDDDDDAEESESEADDHQSAFTISDDSDDGSEDSDASSFGRGRGRGTVKKTPPGGRPSRKKTTTQTKPSKKYTTPKDGNKSNRHSQAKDRSKSTLAFRKNRDALTSHTFTEFNQGAFGGALSSVSVTWSNKLNTTAGITRMRGKLGNQHADSRVATIELATKVIDDEDRLRSTLLHEMCHAASWLVDGIHKPPHGKNFKKWASISMRKIRDVEVTTTHDYQIAYKYAWACTATNCSVVIKRHSRSVDPSKHCCGRCQGKLIEIEVPGSNGDTSKGGYAAKKERKASQYALFVKSQSKSVRESLAKQRSCTPKEVSQADVMKECGKLWRERKASSSSDGSEKNSVDSMADGIVNLTLD